ncbi:MAG: YgjV family protein [Clostridiales bacterium]|nr:YgjV family protein [Clostridiales bacterium]
MSTWCIFFQILGVVFVLAAGLCQKKNGILFLTFCANVCSVLVMFLAGRYDGVAATVVCTLRAFLFLFRDRAKSNWIYWISTGAHLIVGVLAWQSPMSLLIILAPMVICTVNWFGNVETIKWGTIVSDCCWAVFDFSCGVYIEGMRDLAETCANVIGLWKSRQSRGKRKGRQSG